MMQRHHVPLVVEHRRTGAARRGVGLVVDEVGVAPDHLVLAQRGLLACCRRVLDDADVLAPLQLARIGGEPQIAVGRQWRAVVGGGCQRRRS